MKDHEIISLYWQRKEAAITASADKYGSYCHTISYNILHDNEDAAECVNDTWLGAWKSIPPKRPERLSTYLGKITRNLSLDRIKKYSAEKRGLGQAELALSELEDCIPAKTSVEQLADDRLLTESINDYLYAQSKQKRNVFIRRYWYLYSIQDIAAFYGMSESKVSSLLFRMRKDLRIHLEREGIFL